MGKVGYAYFTDSTPNNISFVNPSGSSVSTVQGSSAVFNVEIKFTGNKNSCTVNLSTSGLPTGTTENWSGGNSITVEQAGNTTIVKTLTITTSGTTPINSFSFLVSATPTACPGGDIVNASGNLNVTAPSCTVPVLSVPGVIEVNSAANLCNTIVNYTATSTGTPAPDITYSFSGDTTGSGTGTGSGSSFNVGTTTVEITATNSCGSDTETFTVTVVDDTAPVVDAVSQITVTLDASGAGSLAVGDVLNSTSTDACGIASEVLSQTSFGCS
ncbi:hypothetical protein, partial [Christiangramia sediminis]|uniref:hypothetical protein n=1 Tax=Christiangramia sediminis TaxID=2881336 RepID=UPI001E583C98